MAPLIGIEATSYATDETQQWLAQQIGAEFAELAQCDQKMAEIQRLEAQG